MRNGVKLKVGNNFKLQIILVDLKQQKMNLPLVILIIIEMNSGFQLPLNDIHRIIEGNNVQIYMTKAEDY